MALGTNKLIGISTALASTTRYGIGKQIQWKLIWPAAVLAGTLGAAGAFTATRLSPEVLHPIILLGLVAVGLYVLTQRKFGQEVGIRRLRRMEWAWLIAGGIGFYDGFFGPGTGTFLMMMFVLGLGFDLLSASANSRVVNLASNLGALSFFTFGGYVEFKMALPAAVASFCGGLLGATWALKHGSKAIRPIYLLVVWGLIAKLAYDLFKPGN